MRKPCSRIDIVELGSLDQCVNGSGAAAAFIGAGEGPVVATDRDAAQRSLSSIVGHAQPSVVEETGEDAPAFETVVDGLCRIVLG